MSSDWYYVVRTRWGWLLWEECDLLVSDVGRRAGERLGHNCRCRIAPAITAVNSTACIDCVLMARRDSWDKNY